MRNSTRNSVLGFPESNPNSPPRVFGSPVSSDIYSCICEVDGTEEIRMYMFVALLLILVYKDECLFSASGH